MLARAAYLLPWIQHLQQAQHAKGTVALHVLLWQSVNTMRHIRLWRTRHKVVCVVG